MVDLYCYRPPDLDMQPEPIVLVLDTLNASACKTNVDVDPSNVQVMASVQYSSMLVVNAMTEEVKGSGYLLEEDE